MKVRVGEMSLFILITKVRVKMVVRRKRVDVICSCTLLKKGRKDLFWEPYVRSQLLNLQWIIILLSIASFHVRNLEEVLMRLSCCFRMYQDSQPLQNNIETSAYYV